MPIISIDDVNLHVKDAAAVRVVEIYAKNPPYYAVYRTPTRVVVHYADDPVLARAQRSALAPLNPLRGVINSLLDGWKPARAQRFSRGVADALVVALEGDMAGAAVILQNVKQEIIDERTSWARFQYLIIALLTAVVLITACSYAYGDWFSHKIGLPPEGRGIWQAGGGGAVGAFFSIATAMRKRTVLTDLQWLDNAADAILRITIGLIAAMLLFCMLQAHLVNISLASTGPGKTAAEQWMWIIVVGFTAGFLERLVPDLLEKSTLVTASSVHPAHPTEPFKTSGGAPSPAILAARPAPAVVTDIEGDEHLCAEGVSAAEATPDHQLPPAIGGVAART